MREGEERECAGVLVYAVYTRVCEAARDSHTHHSTTHNSTTYHNISHHKTTRRPSLLVLLSLTSAASIRLTSYVLDR
jgi:hypothetical protein